MEPWGTPALIGYSCKDFISRAPWICLLLRKEQIRPNIWPEIPNDLSLWRRAACQTLSKALDISSATARVAPDLLKALIILSVTTVTRSAEDREDLKPYWKSEKRPDSSRSTILLFKSFFKDFTNHRNKTNRAVVLTVDISPTFLNTSTTDEAFQQSGEQDSFRHISKTSASFYEILGSQFFRTTTEIQSALDAFDESRFVIIFLTIVGVAEILCSLALVLEEKIGKEILKSLRLEFWEKFLANNFA